MIHATVNGIRAIYDWVTPGETPDPFSRDRASLRGTADRYACNWEQTPLSSDYRFFAHADGKKTGPRNPLGRATHVSYVRRPGRCSIGTQGTSHFSMNLLLSLNLLGMRKAIAAGTVFGRLTTTGKSETRNTNRCYECSCSCGTVVWVQRPNLVYGHSQSCGCLRSEMLKASKRKHQSTPPVNEELTHYRYTAKKRGFEWGLNQADAAALLFEKCHYCGAPPARLITSRGGDSETVSGIDRVDSTKGYVKENCVPCCTMCNMSKNDHSLEEWNAWLDRILAFRASQSKTE